MFKNILLAVNLEDDTYIDGLLRVASDIAKTHGAQVHLLHIIGAAPAVVSQFLPENYEKMAAGKFEEDLAALAAKVELAEGAATSSVRFGDVYREILAHAKNTSADLIIIGSHKPDATDFLLGTNAARVVRHASCSVFVVR